MKPKTAIIQDYHSGEILFEKEADLSIYPASMTKIMTSIIAFDLIKSGDLSMDEKFIISEKAWRLSTSGYSSMFIMVGDEVSVENLLKGIIIASGNDACIALAECIAGTEEEFAILMTAKAIDDRNGTDENGVELNPVVVIKGLKTIKKEMIDNQCAGILAPSDWMVVKASNSDTTFYTLKNKKTGTKLSNRFYSKKKANEELKNFRRILTK